MVIRGGAHAGGRIEVRAAARRRWLSRLVVATRMVRHDPMDHGGRDAGAGRMGTVPGDRECSRGRADRPLCGRGDGGGQRSGGRQWRGQFAHQQPAAGRQ